jgi:hypothetical protein
LANQSVTIGGKSEFVFSRAVSAVTKGKCSRNFSAIRNSSSRARARWAGRSQLLAAKRLPGTVIAVIGVDTLQNAEFKLPEEVRKSILDDIEKDFKGTVRLTIAGLLPEKADAKLKTWLQTKAEGQDPKMALALMRDLFGLDTSKLLKEAKVPVRCINSAGGYKFFTPTAVETNKKYADFGAVTIDGVGQALRGPTVEEGSLVAASPQSACLRGEQNSALGDLQVI